MSRFLVAAFLLFSANLQAHVGSPDIFFEGSAGPYALSTAIRPPAIIPGIAEIEIRTTATNIRSVQVVPYPLSGIGSKYPPVPDAAKQSRDDPRLYTASVWLMAFGSYQVRIDVEGPSGRGSLSVPLPSVSRETKQMQAGFGWLLAIMMVVLAAGAVSITGAAARESTLPEAESPGPKRRRASRLVMTVASFAIAGILFLGNWWWGVEASGYRAHVYKQPVMQTSLRNGVLSLQLETTRKPDDYLPDHGHLMHLFIVRIPEMDRMWHLHPELAGNSEFRIAAPSFPAGRYKLFADIVHGSGFPETPVAELALPQPLSGTLLSGDDVVGSAPPLSNFDSQRSVFRLSGGAVMLRSAVPVPIAARQVQHLRFDVQNGQGEPVRDMERYMGMAAHAELISADASVFAHVHPSGTVPMASLGLAGNASSIHQGHMDMTPPARFTFPYGFPKAGRYRIFIQIQRAGHPETASFDYVVQ